MKASCPQTHRVKREATFFPTEARPDTYRHLGTSRTRKSGWSKPTMTPSRGLRLDDNR
jgi:hypothetical protein